MVVFLATVDPQPAHAMSCSPMVEAYYLSCDSGSCTPLFQATPVEAPGGPCARRNRLSPVNPTFAGYLGQVARAAAPSGQSGVYSLTFRFRWYQYEPSLSFDEWRKNLVRESLYLPSPAPGSPEISAIEFVRQMNQQNRRDWLKLESSQMDVATINALRQRLEEESRRAWLSGVFSVAVVWVIALAFIAALAYSARLFHRSLASSSANANKTRLALLLVGQIAIVGAVIFSSVFSVGLFLMLMTAPHILFVMPTPLLIWTLETYWLFRYRSKLSFWPTTK